VTRRFGTRTQEPADNETVGSAHPHPGEGSEHGVPEYPDPLPGIHHYPEHEPAVGETLAVPAAKPFYSGGNAHGVKPVIRHGGRPSPRGEDAHLYRTEDEVFPPIGGWKGEPLPVTVTKGNQLIRSAFRQVGVIPGADPVVLAPRNDARVKLYMLNETAAGITSQVTGSQTSPVAGTVIAQVTGLPAGIYQVSWTVSLGGTTSGTDADNFALNVNAVQQLVAMNGSGSGTVAPQSPVTVTVPAAGSVSVTAIANATAGAVYRAQIVLTPENQGGVRLKNGPDSETGSLLPATGRYFDVFTQDVVYAIADPSAQTEQLVSVIEEYTVYR
jgi:hypothetical protein